MNQGKVDSVTYQRWIPVLAGVAIQMCLGTSYIWGVFQPEVVQALAWNNKGAALTFSMLLGIIALGSMVGGLIQDRFSPRPAIMGGGLIMGLGFYLASFATPEAPWVMWLTYGIIGGFGMGTTYTTTIAVCQKWFPDKRGFITGIIVSALGFGGLVFTPVAKSLIAYAGVMDTFKWLAIIFVIVTLIGSFFIKNPPANYRPAGWSPPERKDGESVAQNFTPLQMLGTPQFYMIAVVFMLASAAGLMVIPFAIVLGKSGGLSDAAATSGVMVISAFNSFGRLFWGWVSDRLGRKRTLLLLLSITAVTILFVASAKMYLILVLIAIVGFSYGGFLGIFPALTADYFGTKNLGTNYGLVMFGFGIGAVASSYVAGYFKDLTGGFTIPFLVAASGAFVAAVIVLMLKNPRLKEVPTKQIAKSI